MQIQCPQCFANFKLPDELAGRKVQCNHCASKFRMPVSADVKAETAAEVFQKIATRCPRCLADYNLKPKFAGKTVRCRECKSPFVVPGVDPDTAPVEPQYESYADQDSSYVQEEKYVKQPDRQVKKASVKPKQESLFDEYELAEMEQAAPLPISRPRRAAVSQLGTPRTRTSSRNRSSSYGAPDFNASSRSYSSSNSSGMAAKVGGVIMAIVLTLFSMSAKLLKRASVRNRIRQEINERRDRNEATNEDTNKTASPFRPLAGN